MAESLMSEAISGPTYQVHQLQRVPFDKLLREEWFQCRDNINLIVLALKSKEKKQPGGQTAIVRVIQATRRCICLQGKGSTSIQSALPTELVRPRSTLYYSAGCVSHWIFVLLSTLTSPSGLALGRKLVSFVCLNISRKWPSSQTRFPCWSHSW